MIRLLILPGLSFLAFAFWADDAFAHASEGGFVLLLPTRLYILSGCAAVALSVLIVGLMPGRWLERIFTPLRIGVARRPKGQWITSLAATVAVFGLVAIGWFGPHDPLGNLLPLTIWTLFWIGFVVIQALIGDLWAWINPWSGLAALIGPDKAPVALPDRLGHWPGVVSLIAFALFALVYPAPDDPSRLAVLVAAYWSLMFLGCLLFGAEIWLPRAECFTILLRLFASLAPLRRSDAWALGLSGWRAFHLPTPPVSLAVFIIALLGIGSFDGLNETFWWLVQIGVNPLEFPGRSALIGRTTLGLVAAVALLIALFAACVWSGLWLADRSQAPSPSFSAAFGHLSLSLLPIALGYHLAHFLVAFLVNIQYVAVALSDPLQSGRDILNLGDHYVSTGFLKSRDPVRAIWQTQAGVIVAAHILAVFMAHHSATQMFRSRSRTMLSQVPLAAFMVLYTLFGLWLLATARGA
ncbi:MAG: hypothetical protein GKR99_15340 [Rhodobacteraceae bacterium]|nr:hypothetical protein [Paracoccaceae bacterium]